MIAPRLAARALPRKQMATRRSWHGSTGNGPGLRRGLRISVKPATAIRRQKCPVDQRVVGDVDPCKRGNPDPALRLPRPARSPPAQRISLVAVDELGDDAKPDAGPAVTIAPVRRG